MLHAALTWCTSRRSASSHLQYAAPLLLAMLAGCSKCGTSTESPGPTPDAEGSATLRDAERTHAAIPEAGATPSIQRRDETSTEANNAFAKASSAFALDLYGQLRTVPGNLVFSPASIAVALTLTWAGARGETAAQMARALHFTLPAEGIHGAASRLIQRWNEPRANTYELRVLDRLFGSQRFTLVPSFVETTKRYGAEVELLDFQTNPEPARVHINDWVQRVTNQRIREVIPAGGITKVTALVLTNAVYFLGRWTKRFDRNDTQQGPFYLADRHQVNVPLMQQSDTFGYAKVPGAQVLEMGYAGDDLAMTVVLPDHRNGLGELERTLSLDAFGRYTEGLHPQQVKVVFPRFRLDPPSSLSVRGALSSLGMRLAFTDHADFGGMVANAPLMIDEVYHKAFVQLDEEGTKAAAATAVVMAPAGVAEPRSVPEFRADHPFLFLIRAVDSGAILFLGRVSDPSQG
jgi:serpin B